MTDERYYEILEMLRVGFDEPNQEQLLKTLSFDIDDRKMLKDIMKEVKDKFDGEEVEFIDKLFKKLVMDAKPWAKYSFVLGWEDKSFTRIKSCELSRK